MKKIIILFVSLFFMNAIHAQKVNPYTGSYSLIKEGGDMLSFLFLYIMPNNTYAYLFFGGMEIGTWREADGRLVMQSDTTNNEYFDVFATYNKNEKDIKLEFIGFHNTAAIFSFDNENGSEKMHPVFNADANCFSSPTQAKIKKGEHKTIQLASFAGLKYQKDSTTNTIYTFPLNERYNDFKLVLNERKNYPVISSIGTIDEETGILYIDKDKFRMKEKWEYMAEDNEAKIFMKYIEDKMKPSNSTSFEEYGNEDENESSTVEYSRVDYIKKEVKFVLIDEQNLFESRCNE